jgi:hypothetical protein
MRNADRRRVAPLRGHTPLRWRGEGGIRGGIGQSASCLRIFRTRQRYPSRVIRGVIGARGASLYRYLRLPYAAIAEEIGKPLKRSRMGSKE